MPPMSYPLANASGLSGTKQDMRRLNEQRIRVSLLRLASRPRNYPRQRECGHQQTAPELVTGSTTNGWRMGAYMQRCLNDSYAPLPPACSSAKYLTTGLPQTSLRVQPLASYLAVREELAVIHRVGRTCKAHHPASHTSSHTPHPRRQHSPPAQSIPTVMEQRGRSAQTAAPAFIDLTVDDDDEDEGHVTVLIWTQARRDAFHIVLPISAGRLTLSSHKCVLGKAGVEKCPLHHYDPKEKMWQCIHWTTPLPAKRNGIVLLRQQGIQEYQMDGIHRHSAYA